jgi:aminopeptidase N
MKNPDHKKVYRQDYLPSPYLAESIQLLFQLNSRKTRVVAITQLKRNGKFPGEVGELHLDGEFLTLIDIAIDAVPLKKDRFKLGTNKLILFDPPETFTLQVTTEIDPEANTALSGLYRSGGNYCTQCEAEGFRRITYYLDRPDVLATFTTRIEADRTQCPVLLSNGNLLEKGMLEGNDHYAVWQDPYPKPCYLFALVAGDLSCIQDGFKTQSGKEIALRIYVEPRNKEKCSHAMASIKKAMRWDEQKYGLEYDLENYMIVAVDDFNMGAMENKGLNIFNSKYVLASPESATDQDYVGIEGVVAHEYFHNWTGNRVTCRDWFQLSLKEGLTVFRDQEFSADMNSRATQRISDVTVLRNSQFREDAGPMAHPVRPDSYVEINNFYTVTVYNKGAEVVRMLHKIIGEKKFRKGMDLYFEKFDGKAVTCDDFVDTMSEASGTDLEQFKLWYSQSGTPVLEVEEDWNEKSKKFSLKITQKCLPTPSQPDKKPFHIPVEIGLLYSPKSLTSQPASEDDEESHMLELTDRKHEYSFSHFENKPILSFLRDFTAPVKVERFQRREELCYLMARDSNLFNRWDSAFQLSVEIINDFINALRGKAEPGMDRDYLDAFSLCLQDDSDPALTAHALTLPTETYLAQQMEIVEPELLYRAVSSVKESLSTSLYEQFFQVYRICADSSEYTITPRAMGRRSLKNCCLSYMMAPGVADRESIAICLEQYYRKENMTDVIAALTALSHLDIPERKDAFADFYDEWRNNPLVVDKWLSLQAASSLPDTLSTVRELMKHEAFTLTNPNKVRALVGVFCSSNHARFHDDSGAGYRFLTEQVLRLDPINPQIAAKLLVPFTSYSRYTKKLKAMMGEQLQVIHSQKGLSADVYEIIEKCLG